MGLANFLNVYQAIQILLSFIRIKMVEFKFILKNQVNETSKKIE